MLLLVANVTGRHSAPATNHFPIKSLPPSPLQPLPHPAATAAGILLYCKRDDLYTPAPGTALQGNKVRKLSGFIRAALALAQRPLFMSFGGAFSNHLSALATAGRLYGFPVVIFVRGEEADNPILDQAKSDGAQLIHLSRSEYRLRYDSDWLNARRTELAARYGLPVSAVWPIAEGGTCPGSARSVGKLYDEVTTQMGSVADYLCISAGTGGSAAGVILAAHPATRIEVFPALKGDWMTKEIKHFLPVDCGKNWACVQDYHFGGYGKFPKEWIIASRGRAKIADIGEPGLPPLEPVYTAKLFYGVLDRVRRGAYPAGSSVVVVHTGGIY